MHPKVARVQGHDSIARMKNKFTAFSVFVLGCILLIWVSRIYQNQVKSIQFGTERENQIQALRGQFGDSFGGLTSILSAFTVLGLMVTIFYQRQELAHQKEELRDAANDREEAARTQLKVVQAMERQAESLKQAAAISALSARIAIHTQELEHCHHIHRNGGSVLIGDGNVNRIADERESLIVELDKLKESALRA